MNSQPSASSTAPPAHDFVLLHQPEIKRSLAAVFFLSALLVILRWKALLNLDSAYLGGVNGDGGLYLWLVNSNLRDLWRLPWFSTTAFYPYGATLAWSDNFILPSFVIGVLRLIQVPEAASYNLVILFANLLNGWCTWRLSYALTRSMIPALMAGTVMLSYAFLTAHLGHPQLQFFFWLPLGIFALLKVLRRPSLRGGAVVGLCVAGAFFSAVYYSVFLILAVGAVVVATTILRPRHFTRRAWALMAGGAVLGAAPLLPTLGPYFAVMETFGERHLYEPYYFAASIASYLSSTPLSLLYLETASWTHAEANLFPGFAVFLLAAIAGARLMEGSLRPLGIATLACLTVGALATYTELPDPYSKYIAAGSLWIALALLVWLIGRLGRLERDAGFAIITNRGLVAIFLLCAFLFFLLSLGPLGNPEKHELALGPYVVPYYLVPGVSAVRAAGRYGVVCIFAITIVASLGIAHLLARKRIKPFLAALALPIVFLENYSPDYALESKLPAGSVYDALATAAITNEALIVLPLTTVLRPDGQVSSWSDFARLNVNAMLDGFRTRRFIVNGYTGQRSKIMREFPRALAGFPDERSRAALRHIVGLQYVIYSSSEVPNFDQVQFERAIEESGSELQFLQRDEKGNYLFEFHPEMPISPDSYLLAPSYTAGTLVLELRAAPVVGRPDQKIEVYLIDQVGPEPITSFVVPADGEVRTAQIPLPQTADTVRPLKFTFKVTSTENSGADTKAGGDVTLLRSRFVSE